MALADYSKAIELSPNIAAAYYDRGTVKEQKGDHEGAIADLSKAIELNPRSDVAYYNRGLAEEHKGDHDAAILDYSKAIRASLFGPRIRQGKKEGL